MFRRRRPHCASTFPLLLLLLLSLSSLLCQPSISFDLRDNTPKGHLIGSVDFNGARFYSLLMSSPYSSLFHVNSSTGQLMTSQLIDRDLLCKTALQCCQLTPIPTRYPGGGGGGRVCVLKLSVSSRESPAATPHLHEVELRILEENDHVPQFKYNPGFESTPGSHAYFSQPDPVDNQSNQQSPPVLTINMSESSPLGYRLRLPLAEDIDAPPYDVQEYRLELSSSPLHDSPFTLEKAFDNSADGRSSIRRLEAILVDKLDRETIEEFTFNLLAVDGGNPPQTGSLSLVVNVVDSNDHAPVFSQQVYETSVREGQMPSDPIIIRLNATDSDSGPNALIHYRFATASSDGNSAGSLPNQQQQTASPSYWFRLVKSTGLILLQRPLDYEVKRRHEFQVVAYNPTTTTHNAMSSNSHHSAPSMTSATATVIVNVENIDDELPVIVIDYVNENPAAGQYKEIKENINPPYFIAFITAHDPDCDDGDSTSVDHLLPFEIYNPLCPTPIRCQLSDPLQTASYELALDQPSGYRQSITTRYALSTKRALDREQADEHRIGIVCRDSGSPPKTSTATVVVHIIDENDSVPQLKVTAPNGSPLHPINFDESSINDDPSKPPDQIIKAYLANVSVVRVFVTENQPPRTLVARLHALDSDSDLNGRVTFHLPPAPVIVGVRRPDSQLVDDWSDKGEWIDLSSSLDALRLFQVDSQSGKLTTRQLIDREQVYSSSTINGGQLFLLVEAKDHGPALSHSAYLLLEVVVDDENDNRPVFAQPNMAFAIRENLRAPAIVGEIQVDDHDLLPRGSPHLRRLHLRIDPGHAKLPFVLHRNAQGQHFLNTSRPLDRELEEAFKFTILATDDNNNGQLIRRDPSRSRRRRIVHTSTATVTVTVIDVNDNEPEVIYPNKHTLNSTVHYVSVLEPVDYEIFTINAKDRDTGPLNGKFHFDMVSSKHQSAATSFTNSDNNRPFVVDHTTGIVRLRRPLYETDLGEYRLQIVVRDEGDPPLETQLSLRLVVDKSQPRGLIYSDRQLTLGKDGQWSSPRQGSVDRERRPIEGSLGERRRTGNVGESIRRTTTTEIILFVFIALIIALIVTLIVICVCYKQHAKPIIRLPRYCRRLTRPFHCCRSDTSKKAVVGKKSADPVDDNPTIEPLLTGRDQGRTIERHHPVYADAMFGACFHHRSDFPPPPPGSYYPASPMLGVGRQPMVYDDHRPSHFYNSSTNLNAPRYYTSSSNQLNSTFNLNHGHCLVTHPSLYRPDTSMAMNMPDVVDPVENNRKQYVGYSQFNTVNPCVGGGGGPTQTLFHPEDQLVSAYARDGGNPRPCLHHHTYNTGRQLTASGQHPRHYSTDTISHPPRRFLSGGNPTTSCYAKCPEVDFRPIDEEDSQHMYQSSPPSHKQRIPSPTLYSTNNANKTSAAAASLHSRNHHMSPPDKLLATTAINDNRPFGSRSLTPWRSDPSLNRFNQHPIDRPTAFKQVGGQHRHPMANEADSGVLLDCSGSPPLIGCSGEVAVDNSTAAVDVNNNRSGEAVDDLIDGDHQDYTISFPRRVQASFV